jgi:hypothetical protein
MANATPSRVGQIKGAGDVRELFLKVFSGEVMTVFDNATVIKDKVRTRTISSGKSAQFPAIGATRAFYHTPGVEITGDAIQHDEKIITIDDLLVAATAISQIDEAMNHYEVRSEYAKRMGQALAQTYDRNLLSLAVKTARDTGVGGTGLGAVGQGNAVSASIGANPTVQQVVDAFYVAARVLDEKNIPESERFAFVPPTVYWSLVTNDKLINRDFNGSNGDYSGGSVFEVAGIKIIKTNNLSQNHTLAGNLNLYPDYASKYAVNASDTRALIMHPDALGTLKLMDLSSEMEWDIRRQVTLMVSKMAVGHGVLRPECLYEIRAA